MMVNDLENQETANPLTNNESLKFFYNILDSVVKADGSDVHLKPNAPVRARIHECNGLQRRGSFEKRRQFLIESAPLTNCKSRDGAWRKCWGSCLIFLYPIELLLIGRGYDER